MDYVPEVIDGAPLANQGPIVSTVGTSGLDYVNMFGTLRLKSVNSNANWRRPKQRDSCTINKMRRCSSS